MSDQPMDRISEHSPVLLNDIAGIVSTEAQRYNDGWAPFAVRHSIAVRVLEWVKATLVRTRQQVTTCGRHLGCRDWRTSSEPPPRTPSHHARPRRCPRLPLWTARTRHPHLRHLR